MADAGLTDALKRGEPLWALLEQTPDGQLPEPITHLGKMLDHLRVDEALKGGDLPPVHPPRVRALNNWVFARVYWLEVAGGSTAASVPLYAHEIHLFVRPEWLIGLRYPPKRWDVMSQASRDDDSYKGSGIPFDRVWGEFHDANLFTGAPFGLAIASTFLKALVASYLSALDRLGVLASAIETNALRRAGSTKSRDRASNSTLIPNVLELRSMLRQVRWAFLPADEASEFATGPFSHVSDRATELAFQDIQAESKRAFETTRDVLDQVQQTVELNTSINAQRLDRSIFILTIFTAAFLGPTVIAGIYGMNFERIPGSGAPDGFLWAVAAMLTLAAVIGLAIWALLGRNKR